MSLTQIDSVAALIVIDLQKGLATLPMAHPASDIIGRAAKLARAFRERHMPVVLVNVAGRAPGRTEAGAPRFSFPPDWTELVPELEQQPGDYLVTKYRVGAFIGTPLDEFLRSRGVTQVLLTGVATSAGVEASGRSAYDLGYNVAFVVDAMTDRAADLHQHSVEKVFPRMGETTTTERVLELLQARATQGDSAPQ